MENSPMAERIEPQIGAPDPRVISILDRLPFYSDAEDAITDETMNTVDQPEIPHSPENTDDEPSPLATHTGRETITEAVGRVASRAKDMSTGHTEDQANERAPEPEDSRAAEPSSKYSRPSRSKTETSKPRQRSAYDLYGDVDLFALADKNYHDKYRADMADVGPMANEAVAIYGEGMLDDQKAALHAEYTDYYTNVVTARYPYVDRDYLARTTPDQAQEDTSEPDVIEAGPDAEQLQIAHGVSEAELATARNELARLSTERRRMVFKNTGKAKDLAEKYADAEEAYKSAYDRAAGTALALLSHQGLTAEEIHAAVIDGTVTEHKKFATAEQKVLQDDDSKLGNLSRMLAKSKKRLFGFNAATGFVGGFLTKKAMNTVVKGTIGTVAAVGAPVAVGVSAALRSTRAIFQVGVGNRVAQHSMQETRAQEDADILTSKVNERISEPMTVDEYIEQSRDALQTTINERVEKDRRYNSKRFWTAVGISGAAAVAGVIVADKTHLLNRQRGTASRPVANNTVSTSRPAAVTPSSTTPNSIPPATPVNPDSIYRIPTGNVSSNTANIYSTPVSTANLSSIPVLEGHGMLDQLQGAGLSSQAAYSAIEKLKSAGLIDAAGTKIQGVVLKGNDVIVYSRGFGDGTLHMPSAAVQILDEARKAYPKAA